MKSTLMLVTLAAAASPTVGSSTKTNAEKVHIATDITQGFFEGAMEKAGFTNLSTCLGHIN